MQVKFFYTLMQKKLKVFCTFSYFIRKTKDDFLTMSNFIIKSKFTERPSERDLKKLFEILENSANFVEKGSLREKIEIWKRKRGGKADE